MLVHTSMQDTNGQICFCHLCLPSVGFGESVRALVLHDLTVSPLGLVGEQHFECTADVLSPHRHGTVIAFPWHLSHLAVVPPEGEHERLFGERLHSMSLLACYHHVVHHLHAPCAHHASSSIPSPFVVWNATKTAMISPIDVQRSVSHATP